MIPALGYLERKAEILFLGGIFIGGGRSLKECNRLFLPIPCLGGKTE